MSFLVLAETKKGGGGGGGGTWINKIRAQQNPNFGLFGLAQPHLNFGLFGQAQQTELKLPAVAIEDLL